MKIPRVKENVFYMANMQLSRKRHGETINAKDMKKWRKKQLFLYVLPGVLLCLLFTYLPLWGWSYAFIKYKPGKNLSNSEFVGFHNFTLLFGNPVIRKNVIQSIKNTLGMNFLSYLVMPVPMFFAIILNELKSTKFKKIVQTVSTLPHFISWVVLYSLVSGLFSHSGLINALLQEHGIISKPIEILTTDKHVWVIQTMLGLWKSLGWSAVIYFAALAGIDQSMYEAAMLDGAGRFQKIWYITIPHLVPTFFVLLIMAMGNMLSTGVDQHFVFGNAMNSEFITTLDLYVYKLGLGGGNISAGVAVGILKTLVGVTLFSVANWLSKKIRGYGIA